MEIGLFSQVASGKMRVNGCKLCQGRFILDSRKNFSTANIRHWNRLPKDVMKLPSLEVFRMPVDVALENVV